MLSILQSFIIACFSQLYVFWIAEILVFNLLCHHNSQPGGRWKGQKSHEPSCSLSHGEGGGHFLCKAKSVFKSNRPICTLVPPGLSGEQIVCILYLFLLHARGDKSPDPGKKTQMCLSLAMLIKIKLFWRCYAITASDCGADKIALV